jgi:hypothetical protein
MQAMCAEIAFLLLGVSPVTPPIRRRGPDVGPDAGAGPLDGDADRHVRRACSTRDQHRSSMASRPRHESNESPHRSHLKKAGRAW